MSTISDRSGHAKPVKFAIYWKATLFILLISGLVNVLIRFAAQQVTQNQNAFSEYADILPGQPEQMTEKRGFTCENNPNKTNYYSSDYAVCMLIPESKTFSKIEVIADHNRIVESRFYVQQNELRYGDLLTVMNISYQKDYKYELFFFWKSFFINVQTLPAKLHYALRPVWKVTFTDVQPPNANSDFRYASSSDTSNK